jgi:hypothetical protein
MNGWIEDDNLFNYDMAHAVMGTESMSRKEVQEELYKCARINWYIAGRGILVQLKKLI